jgi:oxygen-independent coproporphyrinogen-3 oxidase
MPLGIYISVPFCRSKCTYCNFASGVFSAGQMAQYVDRVCSDICNCRGFAAQHGAVVPDQVDSIYLGGGTPSLLPQQQLQRLFKTITNDFQIAPDAEITVECAPGTLTQPILECFQQCGVNRVSLGVQSFVDREAASVARLHTRAKTFDDIENLRSHGISNINVDLIAGLPHQTLESWNESLDQVIATGVPHVSVYMLEVDLDSRLGRELIAGGTKYHAHSVPDDELTALMYDTARARLATNGIAQYEISNFAREGFESRHNLKYWTRQPYLGFGLDAHSMLPAGTTAEGVRMATTDSYDDFFVSSAIEAFPVSRSQALEENFFLGLRLNRGLSLNSVKQAFGRDFEKHAAAIEELLAAEVLALDGDMLRLTDRGRMISNEVFERFILEHDGSAVLA